MDTAAAEAFDSVTFLRSIGGNLDVFRELAGLFVADSARRLAALRDALERQDGEALENAAHVLKGSAGYFCAPRAYAAALKVETLALAADFTLAQEACSKLEHEIIRLTTELASQSSMDEFRLAGTARS